MSYKQLNIHERICIESLYKSGHFRRAIGKILQRHHSTISREIRRLGVKVAYNAQDAQAIRQFSLAKSRYQGKCTPHLVELISSKLKATWSPEQISHTVTAHHISCKTIYNWIERGKLPEINETHLREKGKRRRPKETRGRFSMGLTISQRPSEVESRTSFGHWELDTVVSGKNHKGALATFLERKTRFYIAMKIKDRSALSMQTAIQTLLKALPKGAMKTVTCDRGKEFSCYKNISLPVYFADAYCSWQRGSNENANGLLREFYPKKTNLGLVNNQQLIHNLLLMNSRPRKCLNWCSASQAFLRELSHLT